MVGVARKQQDGVDVPWAALLCASTTASAALRSASAAASAASKAALRAELCRTADCTLSAAPPIFRSSSSENLSSKAGVGADEGAAARGDASSAAAPDSMVEAGAGGQCGGGIISPATGGAAAGLGEDLEDALSLSCPSKGDLGLEVEKALENDFRDGSLKNPDMFVGL